MKTFRGVSAGVVLVAVVTPCAAQELRLKASVDESQVVRPAEFQPPVFGTGSPGSGTAELVVDLETRAFTFRMEITGVDPAILDNTVGANQTAIHVHAGPSHARGPFIIDVHHFGRQDLPDSNGLTPIEGGFRIESSGEITQVQGDLDTGFTPEQIIEFLRTEQSFVAVHTNTNELFRTGAIRGNFSVVPEVVRLRASVDESQVVRPAEFQPPVFGSASPGTGVSFLTVNTVTGAFTFSMEIVGIDPGILDNTVGPNGTAIHVHRGTPDSRGPFVIDVHHMARRVLPAKNGLTPTASGFRLRAEGDITQVQGALDTTFTSEEIIEFLRTEEAFVAVHTTSNELFRTGAIRGNYSIIPDEVRLKATIDESQVVRPVEFQPPVFGTGSPGAGTAHLVVNRITGAFTFDLEVAGLDPVILDNTVGANGTGIHVHRGNPQSRGPFIVDVHHFAREASPETNGITVTGDGFLLHSEGHVTQTQGSLDTGFSMDEILGFLSAEDETFVAVHTTTNELFRTGAIRGNFDHVRDFRFIRGDCNADRRGDIGDVVFMLNFLFGNAATPDCFEACNVNNDGRLNISDPTVLIILLFQGGAALAPPYPICDIDPQWRESIGCERELCQ